MREEEDETLLWPTNLEPNEIVFRLIKFRRDARLSGLTEVAERFDNVESMSASQIDSRVVATISWLQSKPENRAMTKRLEMVAMDLKNLR